MGCRLYPAPSGILVEVDPEYCRLAASRGARFYMDEGGRCLLEPGDALRLGACTTASTVARFAGLLGRSSRRGRGVRPLCVTISEEVLGALDALAKRLGRRRSHVAEALLRLALEELGVRV